jgi:hypothetical protein
MGNWKANGRFSAFCNCHTIKHIGSMPGSAEARGTVRGRKRQVITLPGRGISHQRRVVPQVGHVFTLGSLSSKLPKPAASPGLLAWLPKAEMEAMARQHGMKKRTPKTIVITMSRLLADLELVREQS